NDEALGRLGVTENRGQRLIDLVGERARELAEHSHAREMRQFLTQAPQLVFDAPALGDVDAGPDHPDTATILATHQCAAARTQGVLPSAWNSRCSTSKPAVSPRAQAWAGCSTLSRSSG